MANLPEEIIFEILLHLPVKSLLRFKSLCKSFYATINSRNFIKSHLKTSSDHKRIFHLSYSYPDNSGLYFYAFDVNRGISNSRFQEEQFSLEPQQSLLYGISPFNIHASCNGLILLLVGRYELSVWNPFTREYKCLLACPVVVKADQTSVFFGYDSLRDDYKVLVIKTKEIILNKNVKDRDVGVWIFGFKTRRWRRIQDFPYTEYRVPSGCFVDSSLYFLCYGLVDSSLYFLCYGHRQSNMYKIVAFDVAEESFSEVSLPVHRPGALLSQLQVIEGCLCLRSCSTSNWDIEIYVGKKNGVDFSWSVLCSITTQYINELSHGKLLGYSKEENTILLLYREHVYTYDYVKKEVLKTETVNTNTYPLMNSISCIESLVPINFPEGSRRKRKRICYEET